MRVIAWLHATDFSPFRLFFLLLFFEFERHVQSKEDIFGYYYYFFLVAIFFCDTRDRWRVSQKCGFLPIFGRVFQTRKKNEKKQAKARCLQYFLFIYT